MADSWAEKLDAYLDGELSEADTRSLDQHLKGCTGCAAEVLNKVQLKRAIHTAGQKYKPDPAFRARVQQSIARPAVRVKRIWLASFAGLSLLLAVTILTLTIGLRPRSDRALSELADLHVATLASSNPVDVVSTDRHTVKPWFEGKIPFTFNLPELQDTPFTLIGGKVTYLHQSPGAELIFRIRQHQISVFIFQEQAFRNSRPEENAAAQSFTVQTWSHGGLRYFVIGDVAAPDIDKLSQLLKAAS